MECFVQLTGEVVVMQWPHNQGWTLQGDHIRVFNPKNRDLIASYAPA